LYIKIKITIEAVDHSCLHDKSLFAPHFLLPSKVKQDFFFFFFFEKTLFFFFLKKTKKIKQKLANKLFEVGAFMLFMDAPPNLEFGIDYNAWTIGPLFKGVKLIPPGLHFIYFSWVPL